MIKSYHYIFFSATGLYREVTFIRYKGSIYLLPSFFTLGFHSKKYLSFLRAVFTVRNLLLFTLVFTIWNLLLFYARFHRKESPSFLCAIFTIWNLLLFYARFSPYGISFFFTLVFTVRNLLLFYAQFSL